MSFWRVGPSREVIRLAIFGAAALAAAGAEACWTAGAAYG